MFGRKTRKELERLRFDNQLLEESLKVSRECHNKAVAELYLKDKRLDYVRGELMRSNREIDSLRGKLDTERRRHSFFKRPGKGEWLQIFTPTH